MKPHPLLIAVPMLLGLTITSHTDTSFVEISADPKAFFRLSTP
jgi:hypothetical protein